MRLAHRLGMLPPQRRIAPWTSIGAGGTIPRDRGGMMILPHQKEDLLIAA
jgi:hypothetical protein